MDCPKWCEMYKLYSELDYKKLLCVHEPLGKDWFVCIEGENNE